MAYCLTWSINLNGNATAGSKQHKGRFNENTTSGFLLLNKLIIKTAIKSW
jgi:hypothetical protein